MHVVPAPAKLLALEKLLFAKNFMNYIANQLFFYKHVTEMSLLSCTGITLIQK